MQINPIGSVYGAENLGAEAAGASVALGVVKKGTKKLFGKGKGKGKHKHRTKAHKRKRMARA